jgi:hypothetical protein
MKQCELEPCNCQWPNVTKWFQEIKWEREREIYKFIKGREHNYSIFPVFSPHVLCLDLGFGEHYAVSLCIYRSPVLIVTVKISLWQFDMWKRRKQWVKCKWVHGFYKNIYILTIFYSYNMILSNFSIPLYTTRSISNATCYFLLHTFPNIQSLNTMNVVVYYTTVIAVFGTFCCEILVQLNRSTIGDGLRLQWYKSKQCYKSKLLPIIYMFQLDSRSHLLIVRGEVTHQLILQPRMRRSHAPNQ